MNSSKSGLVLASIGLFMIGSGILDLVLADTRELGVIVLIAGLGMVGVGVALQLRLRRPLP